MEFGIVQYYGSYGKDTCSYCKSQKESSESVGMNTLKISEQSYQYLIDRGWRRSGSYCYKMGKTDCCAFYTIRCDALNFELTRSKRKLLNKMTKFLQTESIKEYINSNKIKKLNSMDYENQLQFKIKGSKVDFNLNNISDATDDADSNRDDNEDIKIDKHKSIDKTIKTDSPSKQANSLVKKQEVTNKNTAISIDQLKESNKRKAKRILRRIDKLKIKFNSTDQDALNLIIKNRKSNKIVHSKLSLEDYINKETGLKNKLKIKVVLANEESGRQSHELYKKYQKIIHKSEDHELDYRNFERFLVSNPFVKKKKSEWKVNDDELPDKYGCYHMQYWLNDELIGVNVIDILPSCVSSVYFFYDPDYSFLNLGTYSSLKEIELVRKLNKCNSNIKYYYMGFYIDSCIKMKYKGNINSSYLLCPETYIFHDYKWCKENYDLTKTNRLTMDKTVQDSDAILNVDEVRILSHNAAMTYGIYRIKFKSKASAQEIKLQRDNVEEYAKLVGNKFIFKNLLYLP